MGMGKLKAWKLGTRLEQICFQAYLPEITPIKAWNQESLEINFFYALTCCNYSIKKLGKILLSFTREREEKLQALILGFFLFSLSCGRQPFEGQK